jgi:hypothetical protein
MLENALSKLKEGAINALRKTAKMKVKGLSLLLIRTVILLVIIAVLMYFGGWMYKLLYKQVADLPAMNELIKTLTSTSFIAAIGFLGKALLDEDGDGESDACQDKKEDEKNERDVKKTDI